MIRRSIFDRFVSLLLCLVFLSQGACDSTALGAMPGWSEYLASSFVRVPGGFVNAAGGNLLIRRTAISIDTPLGTQELGATYNSATGAWRWSFELSYDGSLFVDASGRRLDLSQVPDGADIPGTHWVRVDSDTLQTRGGFVYEFDAGGRLWYQRWVTMDYPRIRYTYSPDALLIEQCLSAAACTSFYDVALRPDGRPAAVTDTRTGRAASYGYTDGMLTTTRTAQEVEAGLPGTTFEYDGDLLTAITNSEGERVEYTYVGKKVRTVVQVGEGNPTHDFLYGVRDDAHGGLFPTTYTNPLGGKVRMYFDAEQKLRERELLSTGDLYLLEWAGRRPSEIRASGGLTTSLVYSGDDLSTVTQPSGNVVQLSYAAGAVNLEDPFARPIARIEDSLGLVEERTYDATGRLDTVTDGQGELVADLDHGPVALASLTNGAGLTWSFPLYGIHGHWLEVDGAREDERAFDPVGNPIATSAGSQEGGVLTRGYDAGRNLTRLDVATTQAGSVLAEESVSVVYRSDGRMEYVARPQGADHDLVYDAIGRVVERRERVDGVWQATTFEYDAAGNLTARERPNGMREEWRYDEYGRVVRHRALRDGSLEGEAITTWRDGRVESYYDSVRDTTELYAYNAAGRLAVVTFGYGETIRAEYDLRSRLTAEIFSLPNQGEIRRLDYEYDLANRRVRTLMGGEELLLETVHAAGRVDRTRYGNGLEREYQYDPATGDLVATRTTDGLGQVVEDTSIVRAAREGPVRYAVEMDKATPLGTTREEYWLGVGGTLASPDRMVGKRVWHWTDGAGSREFVYDGLSNQVDNGAGDVFVYNTEANRLLQATRTSTGESVTYTYDAAGFADSRNGLEIAWTATGRLAAYDDVAIEWDLRGRPVSVTVAGATREFIFFGGAVDSSPTGALGALDLGAVQVPFGSSARLYRHRDFRGNVSFVTDEAGTVVTHHHYGPYGLVASYGTPAGDRTFAGGQEIGGALMILGARIYDPAVGRFLSPDPAFQLLNQYSYTFGNPVFYWDPDGRHQSIADLEQAYADARAETILAWGLYVVSVAGFSTFPTPVTAGFVVLAAAALLKAKELELRALQKLRSAQESEGLATSASVGSPGNFGGGNEDAPRNKAPTDRPPRFRDAVPGPFNQGGATPASPPAPAPTCAPSALSGLSGTPWLLMFLLPIQVALALGVLRQRAEGEGCNWMGRRHSGAGRQRRDPCEASRR